MEVVEDVLAAEEEIELSLGLSIGGGRNLKKKSNVDDQKSMISSITILDFQFCENDMEEESRKRIQNENSSSSCSKLSCCCRVCSSSLSVDDDGGGGGGGVLLDPEKKKMMRREIHKMKRQEARKKQLQKKKTNVVRKYFEEDESEQQQQQQEQICKKKLRSEKEEDVGFPYHHVMPSWIPGPNGDDDVDGNIIVHPIIAQSIPPFDETYSVVLNRELPMMKKSCFDFQQNVNSSRCDGGGGGGGVVGDKTSGSAAGTSSSSSRSSSSAAVSDYGNARSHHAGGSSCETRSHSCQSSPVPEQPQLNVPVMSSNIQVQSDLNTYFNPTECSLVFEKTNTNTNNIDAQSNPTKTEEKQVPVIDPHPIDKHNSVTDYPPPAFLRLDQHSEGAYVENFKPPKPQPPRQLRKTNEETTKPLISEPPRLLTGTNGESNLVTPKLTQPPRLLKRTNEEARNSFIPEPSHQLTETTGESNLITPKLTQPQTESLPRMPCVSTVGNGPNGKTVTGFLYRYTKTEVSIVCVCHGISFSPAEFVKHAGGTDVSHPLKDIVVVP